MRAARRTSWSRLVDCLQLDGARHLEITWSHPTCGWVGRILHTDSCILVSSWSKVPHLSIWSVAVSLVSIDHFCFVPVDADDVVLFHSSCVEKKVLYYWLYQLNESIQHKTLVYLPLMTTCQEADLVFSNKIIKTHKACSGGTKKYFPLQHNWGTTLCSEKNRHLHNS